MVKFYFHYKDRQLSISSKRFFTFFEIFYPIKSSAEEFKNDSKTKDDITNKFLCKMRNSVPFYLDTYGSKLKKSQIKIPGGSDFWYRYQGGGSRSA